MLTQVPSPIVDERSRFAAPSRWQRLANHLASPWTDPDSRRSTSGDDLLPLDGLRGLAGLLVIASHTNAFSMLGQGGTGVLTFFALSGFVLAMPFANDPERILRWRVLAGYVANRSLRILPAYIVALLVIAWLNDYGPEWFFRSATFAVGWGHLWSVAEEVRFYVLFPFVVAFVALVPWRPMRLLALVVMIFFAWSYRNQFEIDMMGNAFIELFFYFFLTGVLACFLSPRVINLTEIPIILWLFSVGSTAILLGIFVSSSDMIAQLWRPIFPSLPPGITLDAMDHPEIWCGLLGFLLVGVTVADRSFAARFLSGWWLRHFGLLSYSMYLFHVPILGILEPYGFKNNGLFVVTVALSYVTAIASYILIEKPFLMLKPRITARETPSPCCPSSCRLR